MRSEESFLKNISLFERGDIVRIPKNTNLWLVWSVCQDGGYFLARPDEECENGWRIIKYLDIGNLITVFSKKTRRPKRKKESLQQSSESIKPLTPEEIRKQCDEKFGSSIFSNDEDPNEQISPPEMRMLFGAIKQIQWPNGASLSEEDAKKIIYRKYKITSLKHLARKEFHEVMDVLGHVAAGRFQLKVNSEGYPYIAHAPQSDNS